MRILYLMAMYTGVRAAFNLTRSFGLPRSAAAVIDQGTLQLAGFGLARVRVHSRPSSSALPPGRNAGMISVRLESPGIAKTTYALLRLTSHFGCGHIEIAFFEEQGQIVLYAVRNILRSNLDRLNWHRTSKRLRLSKDDDEIVVIESTINALNANGIETSFASPEDSVRFAINLNLLASQKRDAAQKTIHKKYKRIAKKLKKSQ